MSLNLRFLIVLVMVLSTLGTALLFAGRHASGLYFHEVNQNLNGSIAMYVVDRLPLMSAGEVNEAALLSLADQAMTVNPSVEVYLLDVHGEIVAHAMDDPELIGQRVNLAPVHEFLAREDQRLIFGDDPRSPLQKAFSAHPIESEEGRQGYLYVVLGGQQFDAVQAQFFGSFIGRMALAALGVVLTLGGVIGFVLLTRVSRPLRQLGSAVHHYAATGFSDDAQIRAVPDQIREVADLKREVTRLTDQLSEQFDQLETNDRLRRELVANVSHDLRTPLASMQGYLETLLVKGDSLTSEQRERFLEVAHKHTRQLNRMVADLFELAKLDSGAVRLESEPFLLGELLQDVVQEFALAAEERGVSLRVAGSEFVKTRVVLGDISLLQRVFENLVSNALRYTSVGGLIEVELSERDGQVAVAVRDSGCGIDERLLGSIFERHIGSESSGEGSGLGLAIVKRILDLHGSVISVTSKVGDGTCFTFALPRAA